MSIYNKLQEDLKLSLKEKQLDKLSVLRMLITEIRNKKIDMGDIALEDENVFKVIKKQIKQREDSYSHFEKAGRIESAAKEKMEAEMLKEYLPDAV